LYEESALGIDGTEQNNPLSPVGAERMQVYFLQGFLQANLSSGGLVARFTGMRKTACAWDKISSSIQKLKRSKKRDLV